MTSARIQPLGDAALVCMPAAGASLTLACQSRVWAVAAAAWTWPQVVDVVPGMNNLTIAFDPLAADVDALTAQLAQAWDEASETASSADRVVEIPVRYGGADGPDLDEVARHTGLSVDKVVELHERAEYTVFFLGFQPGFAYLGGLDPRLETPRRAEPRTAVAPGSVGIGGAQTGIYPAASPGGWQLIGRTDAVLFDASRAQPSLLQPGDRVRFKAVGGLQ